MGDYKTAEEVKTEIVTAFPLGCGELFYEIQNDITLLHVYWHDYRILFGTSPERIDLLQWAANSFFGFLEVTMRQDVLLRIARLTDNPGKKFKRASLPLFVELIKPDIDASFAKQLDDLLSKVLTACESIRRLRDRKIAHEDLMTTLQRHPDPLPAISRADIEQAIESIRNLVNGINEHFLLSPTYFQGVHVIDNAESLVRVLAIARKMERDA